MSERGGDDEQSRQEVPQLSNVRPWGSSDLSPRHHRRSWERPDAERQRRIEDRVREQARDQAAHEQGLLSNLQRDQFDPISADHDGDSGATVAVLRRRVVSLRYVKRRLFVICSFTWLPHTNNVYTGRWHTRWCSPVS